MITRIPKTNIALIVALALLLSAISGPLGAYADPRVLQEYEVKAAFLYNFAKFVEWPTDAFSSPSEPLTLGVLDTDPFGDTLKILEDKSAGGRRINIKRFDSVQQLDRCHILFISNSEKGNLPQILTLIKKWNVLTVGEMKGFAEAGGVINFILIDKKIRFEINADAARRAGLKISSQLLKVAKIVR